MMTHSLDDLAALPTEADRAKARGFIDRCAITVLAGLPMRELDEVSRIVPLSDAEKQLVASWSSPETWQPGARHPGRGRYLLKTGQRVGIPVELEYVADESRVYDTDRRALWAQDDVATTAATSALIAPESRSQPTDRTGWPR